MSDEANAAHIPIKGTRDARRVPVKFKPAGPGEKLRERWKKRRESINRTMANAGAALVALDRKPTLPAVIQYLEDRGGSLAPATAARHSSALADARGEWEQRHGREPAWHRRKATLPKTTPTSEDQISPNAKALAKAEARLGRALAELKKANQSRERLAAENAELREQVRRLELGRVVRG